jgi:hypothetical protein
MGALVSSTPQGFGTTTCRRVNQSPVGTTPFCSIIRTSARSGARVRCNTPFGTV